MTIFEWSNQQGRRDRQARLILVRRDEVIKFTGQPIAGVVAIRGTSYEKAGKWSHTTYRLEIAAGWRAIPLLQGWETASFEEGLGTALKLPTPGTWTELADALGMSGPAAARAAFGFATNMVARLDAQSAPLETGPAHKPVLFNTTILTGGVGQYVMTVCSTEQVKALVSAGFDSAIGHAATAAAMSTLLGVDVPVNRVAYEQQPGQIAICLKLRGRLEEGRVLSGEELEVVGYDLFQIVFSR